MDTGWKPNVDMSPNCPRCGSSNTKFCYYNNYSLTQPRYFCKGCRRYWTKGGSLRNVPVGGGCRKNRRGKSLRLSSDHHHHHQHISNRSKSCPTYNGTNSSSSSTNSDGSHIDLALVYANFLNPQQQQESKNLNPNSSSSMCMQEFGGEFDPYFDFANLESNAQQIPNSAVEVGGLGEIESEQLMYYGAMDSMLLAQNKQMQPSDDSHKIVNQVQCDENRDGLIKNGLPPLPGEEGGGSLWSDHDHNHNQSLQVPQPPEIGPETHQDPNSLLFGNWCPF